MAHKTGALRAILIAGFFLTGLTALAAEVILARILGYVFGASHEATATVLAAYMSGLSAGAYCFGRWTSRWRRPLFAYAVLELLVALFYCAIPAGYTSFRTMGVGVATALADHTVALTAARFALSFAFVFGPTLLMGGTLPVLMSAPMWRDRLRGQLPLLYAANTLGAAVGALSAAYRLVPSLGLEGTLSLCALINVIVAAAAYMLSGRLESASWATAEAQEESARDAEPEPIASGEEAPSWLPARAVLGLAFGQGVLVFVLEVLWTHLIGTVIGVTVYAFAVMLTVILLGIGTGSALIPRIRRRLGLSPLALFVWAEVGLALATVAALPLWDRFPLVINLTLAWKADWSFAQRELVRFAYALVLLFPSTLCIGLALPSLIASGRDEDVGRRQTGRWVGGALAANTFGAILGSVFCGFVLLGRLTSPPILVGAAITALALGACAALVSRGVRPIGIPVLATVAGVLVLVTAVSPEWDHARLTAGTHVYWTKWAPEEKGRLVFFAEDAKIGFVTVERQPNGVLMMATNGKYESSNGVSEFQDMLSALGGLYTRSFGRAFLLGMGAGRNVALLREMPFERIDVAEFSATVVDAARRHYPEYVGRTDADERVRIAVDDGRNRLQTLGSPLDLAIVAISSAAYAGSGNLYNRDFFDIVRARLKPDGVFVLWLQLHHLREPVVRSVFYTLRQVFPHVHLYTTPTGAQGFLVASAAPLRIDPRRADALSQEPRMRALLAVLRFPSLVHVASMNVFSTDAEIQDYIGSPRPRLYRDLDPAFEYAAAEGLALPVFLLDLQARSRRELPMFDPPLSEGDALSVRGLRLAASGDKVGAVDHLRRAEALLGTPVWSRQIAELSGH